MQFKSPRFAGDVVLQQILDDPDTGTKKLQSGSDSSAVQKVQALLFDLDWLRRLDVTDAAGFPVGRPQFVIGTYGPITTKVVTGYKQHFDLHFPPTQPTGIIDGFVGPRTLRLLDSHAVLIDTAVAAIEAKRSDLASAGHSVTFSAASTAEPDTRPIPGTQGAKRSCDDLDGELGMIYFNPSAGACALRGGILFAYLDHGQALGPLGFPVTDVAPDGDGYERADFEHGSLRLELASGSVHAGLPPVRESVVF